MVLVPIKWMIKGARRVKPKGSNSYARTDYGLTLLHITFAECKRDKRNMPNVIVTLRINKDRLQMQHHLDAIGHSERQLDILNLKLVPLSWNIWKAGYLASPFRFILNKRLKACSLLRLKSSKLQVENLKTCVLEYGILSITTSEGMDAIGHGFL